MPWGTQDYNYAKTNRQKGTYCKFWGDGINFFIHICANINNLVELSGIQNSFSTVWQKAWRNNCTCPCTYNLYSYRHICTKFKKNYS